MYVCMYECVFRCQHFVDSTLWRKNTVSHSHSHTYIYLELTHSLHMPNTPSQNRIRTEHNMCVVVAVVCTEFNQPEPIVCSHIFAKENENLFERVHGEPRSRLCLDIRFFLHILNFILMLMCNTLCF